jgi:hypothetical protein
MNPYLEREGVWHDFHKHFIAAAAESMGPQVWPHYFVRIEACAGSGATETSASGSTPLTDFGRVSHLAIRECNGHDLVTVVELQPLFRKHSGAASEAYLAEREAFLRGSVHFVEINLLRGGPRMAWLDMPQCDY